MTYIDRNMKGLNIYSWIKTLLQKSYRLIHLPSSVQFNFITMNREMLVRVAMQAT